MRIGKVQLLSWEGYLLLVFEGIGVEVEVYGVKGSPDVYKRQSIKLHYGIEDRPDTWWETLFYAWQITLVDFTPFIWAGAFVAIAGFPDTIIPTMISACFLAMGIGTLIQTIFGNRLPIVQGPSSSVLTAMGGVAAVYGFPAMWGAVIVGGFVEFLIGASRILGRIRRFIPPVVTGSVAVSYTHLDVYKRQLP